MIVVGFLVSVFAFRAAGYEAVFIQNETKIDSQVQGDSTIGKEVYQLPPIVAPYHSEPAQIKPFLGMAQPLFEAPSWMNGANAGRKLNTIMWAILTGAVLYVLIRALLRKPLAQALAPAVRAIDPDDLDEISYRAIAIGFPIFTLGALVFAMIWAQQAWGRFGLGSEGSMGPDYMAVLQRVSAPSFIEGLSRPPGFLASGFGLPRGHVHIGRG
ncbi:hypothetical protein HMSSN036_04020 [Paenibacillus macerans]|nr:hypothetical protein HMSSN036_04020 [Paenibacillus macerans]